MPTIIVVGRCLDTINVKRFNQDIVFFQKKALVSQKQVKNAVPDTPDGIFFNV